MFIYQQPPSAEFSGESKQAAALGLGTQAGSWPMADGQAHWDSPDSSGSKWIAHYESDWPHDSVACSDSSVNTFRTSHLRKLMWGMTTGAAAWITVSWTWEGPWKCCSCSVCSSRMAWWPATIFCNRHKGQGRHDGVFSSITWVSAPVWYSQFTFEETEGRLGTTQKWSLFSLC